MAARGRLHARCGAACQARAGRVCSAGRARRGEPVCIGGLGLPGEALAALAGEAGTLPALSGVAIILRAPSPRRMRKRAADWTSPDWVRPGWQVTRRGH